VEDRRTERGWVATLLFTAASLGLLCAVPVLLFQGLWSKVTFFGTSPPPESVTQSQRLLWAALITALGASLIGVITGWWLKLTKAVVVMSVVLFASVLVLVATTVKPAEPPSSPRHCQERSGGGNDCPGE
jgi:uncharacterized membrane protein